MKQKDPIIKYSRLMQFMHRRRDHQIKPHILEYYKPTSFRVESFYQFYKEKAN